MKMDGILPLYKEKNMTSHDCVMKVRKLLRTKKVGHTGTLDPDVEGVLPICIGRATKLVEYLTDTSKTYEAVVTLGKATTTEDAGGEVIETKNIAQPIRVEAIEQALSSFVGTIKQIPPMYSAIKVKGKKLYEYARQGLEVERPERTVTIYSIELLSEIKEITEQTPSFKIKVSCSKGTYIRTLAVDIGKKLGYPAHMSHLVRTEASGIELTECITLAEMEKKFQNQELELIPMEQMVKDMPIYTVSDELKEKVLHGAVIKIPQHIQFEQYIAIFDNAENLLATYEKYPKKEGYMKPHKVLMV